DPAPLALYDPVTYDTSIARQYGGAQRLGQGDINGDGLPDLISGGVGFFRVSLGQTDGKFNLLAAQETAPGLNLGDVSAFALGDYNEDGQMDVAIGSYFG